MYPESEPRRGSFGGAVFAIVVIALMCYLTFAALQGEHGLFRLFQIEAQETRLRAELAGAAGRAGGRSPTRRGGFRPSSLDLDLLDEQARKVLGPRPAGRDHHPLSAARRARTISGFPCSANAGIIEIVQG